MIKKIVIANLISYGLFTVLAYAAVPLLTKATMRSIGSLTEFDN